MCNLRVSIPIDEIMQGLSKFVEFFFHHQVLDSRRIHVEDSKRITRNTTEADCSLYSSFTAKYPNMVVIIMTPMVVNSVDMEIKRVVTK